jgi:stress response protein YsnF
MSQDHDPATVSAIAEKYSLSKRVVTQEYTIEKRWVSGVATIRIPIQYEEIYVNGKKFGSRSLKNVLSSLKGEGAAEKVARKKAALKGELVPIEGAFEQVLPLFGEEILVRKRMRNVGEAVIIKRKITDNKEVPIEIRGERIILAHPDGTKQEIASIDRMPSTAL